jgi:hypothetical protein
MRLRLVEFLTLLPKELPDPEVLLEGDGGYCVSWYWGKDKAFSVSVGTDLYAFGCLMGKDSRDSFHGSFKRGEEPKLVETILRIVPHPGAEH